MKRLLKKVMEGIGGLAVIIGVLYVVSGFVERGADAAAMAEDLTLAGYARLAPEARLKRVSTAADAVDAADRVDEFVDCMGEFAATKSPDLRFDAVFGWCDLERTNSPEAFAAHFNELDAPDMSMAALTMCELMVKNRLTSPASAKFTFVEPIARGRQRYLVSSHVDAQNGFGAMLRARYVCEIQYEGVGDPLNASSWSIVQLAMED